MEFSLPHLSGNGRVYMGEAFESGHWQADGPFAERALAQIQEVLREDNVCLTSSATASLELASLLLDLGEGDEVIVPSFTFPSAASAVSLFGATPVFVDCLTSSGNPDPSQVEMALTSRTKAISTLNYGGSVEGLDEILTIGRDHGLPVIEDSAHAFGVMGTKGALGTFGEFGVWSFHGTKNVSSGEGGLFFARNQEDFERALVIRQKGTNRHSFLKGTVSKYSAMDKGSSWVLSDLAASLLLSQVEELEMIQQRRVELQTRLVEGIGPSLEDSGWRILGRDDETFRRTSHMFALIAPNLKARDSALTSLRQAGVPASHHYLPLHTSQHGKRYGKSPLDLRRSSFFSERLLRLPFHTQISNQEERYVIQQVSEVVSESKNGFVVSA